MSNLKKHMFKGYAFFAVSVIVGTSFIPASGVYGEIHPLSQNIISESEAPLKDVKINENFNVDIMNQDISKEEKLLSNGQVINIESSLCIRENPDKNSLGVGVLKNGMTFEILSKTDRWYEIKYNNIQGFVHEDYVKEYENTPPNDAYKEDKTTFKRAIKAELTAYSNDQRCSGEWGSMTAMGTTTRLGVIAAPVNIPLGSKMYIPELTKLKSDGIFDVEDRGGAIKVKADGTYVIDVWLPSYEEAVAFGRKSVTIYLVE